jgi:hypothetical protein
MARAKATTIKQDDAISHLVLMRGERSPKRIHDHLVSDGLITVREDGSFSVSEKTVARRIQELTPADSSPPWLFADADPEEARVALDVVVEVFTSTNGRVWQSRDHVAEVARLRKAVPGIPSLWADNLATAYRLCNEQRRDSRHLDLALALKAWDGFLGADQVARALGLPRSFRVVDDIDGPLFDVDSAVMLVELVTFQGSIEDMSSRLESAASCDSIPEPPDVTVVDWSGRPVEGSGQDPSTPVSTPKPRDAPGQT